MISPFLTAACLHLQQGKIKRECRTIRSTVPNQVLENQQNYFAYKCAQFYTSDWSTVTYKYAAYSGNYLLLPKYILFY